MSNNNTQIVIHLMPDELDQYERQINILTNSVKYLDENDNVEMYSTLNLSSAIFDWEKSSVNKKELIGRFYNINSKLSIPVIEEVVDNNLPYGTTAQKRSAVRECDNNINQFIFLDADIYFHELTLKYILDASKNVTNQYYIISPQTVKLWDNTWDVITNNNFLSEKYGFEKTFDPTTVLSQQVEDVNIVPLQTFKFGCGWFVLYSKNLWQFVDIPDGLGEYGSEDFYLMVASIAMHERGYDIQQYILDGIYIAEDYIYKSDTYKDKIIRKIVSKDTHYIKHDTPEFAKIMHNFLNNLKLKI